MKKIVDLTNKKFGKLTVIKYIKSDKNGPLWECFCDCGNIKYVHGGLLKRGDTKSCGCLLKETGLKRRKDLTGKQFEKLIVIKRVGTDKYGSSLWLCRCECGNEKIVSGGGLRSGNNRSCGCLLTEYQNSRKYMKTIVSQETRKKLSERQIGKLNHNWQGGISFGKYCPKFNKDLKRRVRAFFNYECILCGKKEIHNKIKTGKHYKLDVHHVEYDKQACCDGKEVHFATLCRSCHNKTSRNRERWEAMLHRIINEIYDGRSYYTKEEYKNLENII